MRVNVILIILVTIVLTAFFMENREPVEINLLFTKAYISKLILLPGLVVFGFLVGYIAGRMRKKKVLSNAATSTTFPVHPTTHYTTNLSQEDQDYLR